MIGAREIREHPSRLPLTSLVGDGKEAGLSLLPKGRLVIRVSSTSTEVLRADKVWLDGKFVKWDEGRVHLMTHALHYGLGVFEGIRAYKTHDGRIAIFRLRDHIQRLLD